MALQSEQWGQRVAAIVVLTEQGKLAGKGGKPWGPMDMRRALKDRLANYKIPQEMKVVDSIPRNAMGKSECFLIFVLNSIRTIVLILNAVNKKSLVQEVFPNRPPTPPGMRR